MSTSLAQTLASLHALLTAEGYLAHAQGVHEAQRALEQSDDAVCSTLASNAFWGGPGAIWEIGFSREWFPADAPVDMVAALRARSDDAVNAANHRLAELVVKLSDEFATTCAGHVHPSWIERATYLGSVHKNWIENGIR